MGQDCQRGLGGAAEAWGARALAWRDGNVNMVARVHPEPVEGAWLENQWDLVVGRFQHFTTKLFINDHCWIWKMSKGESELFLYKGGEPAAR